MSIEPRPNSMENRQDLIRPGKRPEPIDIPPPLPEGLKRSTNISIIERLKALSNGKTLPTPQAKLETFQQKNSVLSFSNVFEISPIIDQNEKVMDQGDTIKQSTAIIENALSDNMMLGFGIGSTYKYLSTNGMLIRHKGEDEPLLEYHDSDGHTISRKDAFKELSHAFSGKMPGQAARLKFKNKLDAEQRKNAAQPGETPLQTASALREVLSEKQQPFIELSGRDRTVLPFKAIPHDTKVVTRAKKLKLKKREKETD